MLDLHSLATMKMYCLSASSSAPLWLLAIVLLAGWTVAAQGQELGSSNNEFRGASAELQSVNAYLTGVGPISMDPGVVVKHLEEARALLSAVGDDVIRDGVDSETAEPNVRSLFGNDPDSLKTILNSLIAASKSCDRESVDFLSLVLSQTFTGQFLHSYSQRVADTCIGVQLDRIASRVEKSLNKVGSELYELVADLAQANAARERKSTSARGQIIIADKEKSVDPDEILRTLRSLKFETAAQQRLFGTLIRNYYAEQFPTAEGEQVTARMRRERLRKFFTDSLIDPCGRLVERWTETVNQPASGGVTRRKIAETIESRRKSKPTLDRSVEMVRICRKIQQKSGAILAEVER